ncbi:MAG TPA: ATP cone domain-containing protein [Spirochaetia bacterium]|nr:ATP cone domain-containing protein [Spirochaetia bacterium]
MITHIVKRDGRVVAFDPEKITFAVLRAAVAVGGRDRETAESVTREVVERLEKQHNDRRSERNEYPTVEEVQDAVEKVLIERGHARTAKAYIVYRYEHTLKRANRESLTYSSENIPYRKLWETLSWAVDHNCHTLAGIRDYVERGAYADLVAISEEFYAREIDAARSVLTDRIDEVRVMIIAGPSSSGKTTTTMKIAEAIPDRRLVPINVDNYFFDLATHPTDTRGDYDFETPQALDIELLNEHLNALLSGKSVEIPFYNFKTGNREGVSETIALEQNDIILIDSLHGFYDAMTESVPDAQKFKLYIETLAQVKDDEQRFIRWTDVRMLRRMVRDMQFRNYNPEQTLRHWYLVRRAELRYIVSRLKKAEVIVNSFMPSELPVMKGRLERHFPEFVEHLSGDEEKHDARERARRVIELFAQVPSVPDEDAIPGKSLLREFIGGSTYDYH